MRTRESFLDLMTGVAATCAVVVTVVVVYQQFTTHNATVAARGAPRRENRSVADWDLQVEAGRRIGAASAPLTIVHYGDFECPACKGFTQMVEQFRKEKPEDLSVVFRHLPLAYHRFAYPSARAAECAADQERFEAMYQALYSVQDSLGLLSFREIARRAAVPNLERFDRCVADTAKVLRIERDLAAAKAADLPGTPGVIIAGTLYAEKLPTASDLDQMVRDARARRRE